eukprot:SAG25_NODE_669_length_6038_cov_4.314531_1_plen_182_part_00
MVDRIARFVTPRREGLRILERSRILRPSRRGVTKRCSTRSSTGYYTGTAVNLGRPTRFSPTRPHSRLHLRGFLQEKSYAPMVGGVAVPLTQEARTVNNSCEEETHPAAQCPGNRPLLLASPWHQVGSTRDICGAVAVGASARRHLRSQSPATQSRTLVIVYRSPRFSHTAHCQNRECNTQL